jgi:acyl-coenzyme A synthetase/AMP-(fatty) acid ligase/thioesterase domain-containing protein/acyl carrier protein
MPPPRLAEIVRIGACAAVLTDHAHQHVAADVAPSSTKVLVLPAERESECPVVPVTPGPGDPANVVFTSGSTGHPKGVIVPHGAYLDHALAAAESMDFRPDDTMGMVLPMGFAAAALYLHRGLATGAKIVMYDVRRLGMAGLLECLRSERVTYLDLTPTMLRTLVNALEGHEPLEDLRVVTTAGEPVFGADVRALRRHLPSSSLFINHAGSSETSGYAAHRVPLDGPLPDGPIPAGTALGERILTVRNDDGSEAETGSVGELWVTSPYVSLGYLDQPDLTAERFIFHRDGRRTYKTGDLVVKGSDGVFESRGRRDDMVKIRGYLVEPAEVEAALRSLDEVSAAVVLASGRDGRSGTLSAYVVASRSGVEPSSIRARLRGQLPNYMVPARVLMLPELPLNANGKVDRSSLLALPDDSGDARRAPRDDLELKIAVLWADILDVDEIGVDDDFFELGGDSLDAESAMAALSEDLGLNLSTSVLLEAPTVGSFAQRIRTKRDARTTSTVVCLRATGRRPTLFLVTGAGAQALTWLQLSLALGPDQPVYAVQMQGLDDGRLPDYTLERAARRAVRAVRSVQPTGPYAIAGHSYGGLVAYEMAQQLSAEGQQVSPLALIDVGLLITVPDQGSRVLRTARVWKARVRDLKWLSSPLSPLRLIRHRWESMSAVQFASVLMRRYRPEPWSGRAIVIDASVPSDDLEPMQWKPLLREGFETHSVPGDHVSLLKSPNVGVLADLLRLDPLS